MRGQRCGIILLACWELLGSAAFATPLHSTQPQTTDGAALGAATEAAHLLEVARDSIEAPGLRVHPSLQAAAERLLGELSERAALRLPFDDELEQRLIDEGYVPGRFGLKLGDSNVGWKHLFEEWLREPAKHSDSLFGEAFLDVGVAIGPRRTIDVAESAGDQEEIVVVVLAIDREAWFARQSQELDQVMTVRGSMLEAVNEARERFDRRPLIADERLDRVAERWARELARKLGAQVEPGNEESLGRAKRRRRRGPDLVDLAGEERYRVSRIEANELRGTKIAVEDVVDQWMRAADSQGRLLNTVLRDVGTGWWRGLIDGEPQVIWVQVYGRPGH